MRLLLIIMLLPIFSIGQFDTTKFYRSPNVGEIFRRAKINALMLPSDTTTNKVGIAQIGGVLYSFGSGKWNAIGSADTTILASKAFVNAGLATKQNTLTNPITGTGVSGRVPFYTGTTTLSSDTGFTFNSALERLGINIQNPQNNLDVNGTTFFRDAVYNISSTYGKRLAFHLGGAKSNVFGGHHVGNLTNVGDALGEGRNTAWGTLIMPLITTANRNIGVGFSVMSNLRVGQKNVIISNAGLDNADSVNNNTGVGEHVLRTNSRGNNNTVMGFHSAELYQGSNGVFYGGNVAHNQVNGDGNHIFAYNGTVFDPNGSNQMNFANIIYGTNITGGVNARVGIGTNNPQVFFSLSNNGNPDIGLFKTNGVTNSRNWAFRINGVEEGDFLIYQSAANGTTPLSTARFQISRVGNVNIGTTTTIDNALLNVSSTTRGSMPYPRMTEAQRTTLTVDASRVGMHVYQTNNTEGVYVYKSTGWAFAY